MSHKIFALTFSTLFFLNFSGDLIAQRGYEIFESNKKFGLKNDEGKISVYPKYTKIGWSDGFQFPVGEVIGYYEGAWGLLSLRGRRISTPRYYTLEAIHTGLIIASQRGRFSNELLYGTLNARGETIIDFKYHSITRVRDLLVVSERLAGQSLFGLVSDANQIILPLRYKSIKLFHNDKFVYEDLNERLGIVNSLGNPLIPASIDSIATTNDGAFKIFDSGKVGLIDSSARIIVEPLYKKIASNKSGLLFPSIELRSISHELMSFEADSLQTTDNYFVLVFRNGFVEVLGAVGKVISRYDAILTALSFKENLVVTTKQGVEVFDLNGVHWKGNRFEEVKIDDNYLYAKSREGWQVYNAFGRKLTKRTFEDVKTNSDNLIPVKKKGYWGYLDHRGETAISFRFEDAEVFKNQLANVDYVGYKMLINQFGEQVGEPAYDSIAVQTNNMAVVKAKSRTDILNENGAAVFQTYNELIKHPVGYTELTENGKIGLIGKNGRIIFHPYFQRVSDLSSDQFLSVKSNEGVGLSLADGSWLIAPTDRFDEIAGSKDGHTAVKKNGHWGFLNAYQQLVIANRYDSVRHFCNDRAAILLNGKWGFLDKRDQIIIQPNLDSVEDFNGGLSIVMKNGLKGVIKTDGSYLIPIGYTQLNRVGKKLFLLEKEKKYGLFRFDGSQMLPIGFEKILLAHDGFIVKRRGKYGVVDSTGKYAISLKYDSIYQTSPGKYACVKLPMISDSRQ